MKTSSKGALISLGTVAGIAAGLRLASRFHPSPCPANLSWLLENPYVEAVAGAETILDRMALRPGMHALAAGCGPGRLAVPAAKRVAPGGEVVALDIQEEMLHRTRHRADQAGLSNLRTLQAGIGQGIIPKRYFDRAWLVTVLGEIPDKEAAVAEIFAALKPGGLFSVTEMLPDPDYQSRRTVRRLAAGAGFIEKAEFGNWLSFTLNFVRPSNKETA